MKLLRVRDPKTTVQLKKLTKNVVKSKKLLTSQNSNSSANETKTSDTRLLTSLCENQNSNIGNRSRNQPISVCYASSCSHNCDVVFTNTGQTRLSVIFEVQRRKEEEAETADQPPIDLSVRSAIKSNLPTSETNQGNRVEEDSLGDYSLRISPISSNLTAKEKEVGQDYVSPVSSSLEATDFFPTDRISPAMLSSRRHRSDDNYSDREHFTSHGRKPTYPNPANTWLDDRGSPDHENMNGFPEALGNSNENLESGSEHSYRSENNDESVINNSETQYKNNTEYEHESAFNYSVNSSTPDEEVINNESGTEISLLKAKKARVENIVTSIKDKPTKQVFGDHTALNMDNDDDTNSRFEKRAMSKQRNRNKRKIDEKIRELRKEIASLQQECEVESDNHELSSSDDKEAERTDDWKYQHKRQKINHQSSVTEKSEIDRTRENYNGYYRGSINVALPQNGRRASTGDHFTPAVAYDALVQSLKRELTSALHKVAETSARRVLQEIRYSTLGFEKHDENEASFETNKITRRDSDRFSANARKNYKKDSIDLVNAFHHYNNTSSGLPNGDAERVRTNNHSRLVDSRLQNARDHESRSPTGLNYHSTKEQQPQSENASPESCRETVFSQRVGKSEENHDVQTTALALVKKSKSSTPPSVKPSEVGEDSPFVRFTNDRYSPGRSKTSQKSIADSEKDRGRSSSTSVQEDRELKTDRVSPTSMSGSKILPMSLVAENSFYPSTSSAFRLPLRHEPMGSPSFRREVFAPPSMVKTSFFAPHLYPSTAHSQALFPFTSGQLPFPLLQNFQQRSLANAIADYGNFRERFDSSSNRPAATRTSTREPARTAGIVRSQHCPKPENLDFRSANDVSPYSAASIQEGLTPQHLKKAKLMFFYTRYPSANTLKTYFSDVKFTRATTSQLIKWFSNFREFYYIQMEKFARQALSDGITETSQLQVTRDSELFRVLNLHYNKSNDFKVPDEFPLAALKSLQEFFLAIQSNSDRDPSWKKVIYKVICKMDQDIPEIFKSPNLLEHLDEVAN